MTALNYDRCHRAMLAHEGAWSSHPLDPGAATMYGVTQRVYDAYRKRKHEKLQSVRNISEFETSTIYKKNYWNVIAGDLLPKGLDYVAYDGGVNSGTSRGAKWLQRAVGGPQDGGIGPGTLRACETIRDKPAAIRKACGYRLGFMQGLRIWDTFGKGWARRVASVEALSVRMAIEAQTAAAASTSPKHLAGEPPQESVLDIPPPTTEQIVLADAREEAHKAAGAVKKHSGAAGASGASGAGVGAADAAMTGTGWLLVGALMAGAIAVGFFLWKAHVERQRKLVYEQTLKMGPRIRPI